MLLRVPSLKLCTVVALELAQLYFLNLEAVGSPIE